MHQHLIALVIAVCLATPLWAQCPGLAPQPGLPVPRLSVGTELWGAVGAIRIEGGEPFAPWLIAVDTIGAPPSGGLPGICLGLSANFGVLLDGTTGALPPLDGQGRIQLPLAIPVTSGLPVGLSFELQAAVFGPSGLGLSNGDNWTFRTPRVIVSRTVAQRRELDFYDGRALVQTPGLPRQTTLTQLGGVRVAFSADGERMFVRDLVFSLPNQVRAFSLNTTPPSLIGTLTVPGAPPGSDRMGVVVRDDDLEGYASDLGGAIRIFDADPNSPNFMAFLGTINSTVLGPGPLALSQDGSLLYTVPGSPPPASATSFLSIMDTSSRLEIATAVLTDNAVLPFVGGASRSRLDLSRDERLAVTVSEGFDLQSFGSTFGNISIVDVDPSSASFATELASINVDGFGTRDIIFDRRDPTNSTLFYTELLPNGDFVLTQLDWPTATVIQRVVLSSGVSTFNVGTPGGVQATPDGTILYVWVLPDLSLRALDTATLTELSRTTIGGSGSPVEINVESGPRR